MQEGFWSGLTPSLSSHFVTNDEYGSESIWLSGRLGKSRESANAATLFCASCISTSKFIYLPSYFGQTHINYEIIRMTDFQFLSLNDIKQMLKELKPKAWNCFAIICWLNSTTVEYRWFVISSECTNWNINWTSICLYSKSSFTWMIYQSKRHAVLKKIKDPNEAQENNCHLTRLGWRLKRLTFSSP